MQNGISAALVPNEFPYADIINVQATFQDFFPCVVAAIKVNETGLGQGPTTENDISGDGGHGIMQLTSSWPSDWQEPELNIEYAIEHYMVPAYEYWLGKLQGDDLVRAIAATYNAGLGNALAGHANGNLDEFTTNNYAARCLSHYQALITGVIPQ